MAVAYIVAVILASLLTFFETANKFYFPQSRAQWWKLAAWVALFCFANGALAAALLWLARLIKWKQLLELEPPVQGVVLGLAYLTIARAKFFSIKAPSGEDVPFGPEYLYNLAKDYFYRLFNNVSIQGLLIDVSGLSARSTLADLAKNARLQIENSQILTDLEKTIRKDWLKKVLSDSVSEEEKKNAIAAFALTGRIT